MIDAQRDGENKKLVERQMKGKMDAINPFQVAVK